MILIEGEERNILKILECRAALKNMHIYIMIGRNNIEFYTSCRITVT